MGQRSLTDRNLAIADAVNAVAAERGASSAQVAIAWVRAQQAHSVILPILGARRTEQFEDNLGALELELTAAELARLEEVAASSSGSRMTSAPTASPTAPPVPWSTTPSPPSAHLDTARSTSPA